MNDWKDILINFKDEKITIKYVNGSSCIFKGIGTYMGSTSPNKKEKNELNFNYRKKKN